MKAKRNHQVHESRSSVARALELDCARVFTGPGVDLGVSLGVLS